MSKRRRKSERAAPRRAEPTDQSSTRIEDLCEGIIEAGWLMALALIPLCFNIYSARTFEPDKIALLRSLVVVMVAAWLWKVTSGGRAFRPAAGEQTDRENRFSLARGGWIQTAKRQPLLALATLLAAALVVGSFLSVDQRLSWHGSYPRFQGAWSQLSYLVVFALTVAHLRTRNQWRRIVFVVLVTSVPVTLYALFQAAGLDPLLHDVGTQRAFSTLGNPIFLGAYLLMALFLTILELGHSAVRFWRRRTATFAFTTVTLAVITTLQITALVLTQSRGPFVGALAGAYVFLLVLALVARSRALAPSNSSGVLTRLLRWGWAVVIALALIGAGFLVTFNLQDSPLEKLKQAPYLGRLGSILDFESNTVQVRLLIWQGVVDLLASSEPLAPPGGTADRLEPVRVFTGYGPETFPLAINRFTSPELGQREGRGDIPDRAHNETFDVLVTQGVAGYAIWLALYCTAFLQGLKFLGLVESAPQRLSFWINLSLGAALGALGPYLLKGVWTLSGVGLAAGMIAGLLVFITLEALIGGRAVAAERRLTEIGLVVALLTTLIAHVVEIHFGIAIVSTRLYFWFFLAALLVLSSRWLSLDEPRTAETGDSGNATHARTRRKENAKGPPSPPRRLTSPGVLAGLLVTAICAPMSYGLIVNPEKLTETVPLATASLWQTSSEGSPRPGTLLIVLVLTLTSATALAAGLGSGGGRQTRRSALPTLLFGAAGATAHLLLQARLVAGLSRTHRAVSDPVEAALSNSNIFPTLVWLMMLLLLALGLAIGWRRRDLRSWSRRATPFTAGAGVILTLSVVWLIDSANLDPIRADTLLKTAQSFIAADRPETGLRLLDQACELDSSEPMFLLYRGQAAMRAATVAPNPEVGAEYLESARATLFRAREVAPLDPDHSANIARFFARQALTTEDPTERARLRTRAESEYSQALALRPNSVLFMNELAPLLIQAGRLDEAEKMLDRALVLDGRYTRSYFTLGTLFQTRAATARTADDTVVLLDSLERAVALYHRAVLFRPPIEAAVKELERLEPVLARSPRHRMTPDRLSELYGNEQEVHLRVSRYHLEGGRGERALAHAQLARDLPGEARTTEILALLDEVKASLP